MTDTLDIYAEAPAMTGTRIAGAAFLALGLWAIWAVVRIEPAALVTTPRGVASFAPIFLGVMMAWVGFTNKKMRRRVARVSSHGAQVGVHETLDWTNVARIERHGSGRRETLVLIPAGNNAETGRRELRRYIPVGRAEGRPEALVDAVIAMARAGGVLVSHEGSETWRLETTTSTPARSDVHA